DLAPGGDSLPLRGAPGLLAPSDVGLCLGAPPLQLGQLRVQVLDPVPGVPLGRLGPLQLFVGPALGGLRRAQLAAQLPAPLLPLPAATLGGLPLPRRLLRE